jgi:uncharacterized protein (DUF1778 family)
MPRPTPTKKRKTVPASSSTNFRLTDEQKTLFDAAAAQTGETRSSWMRRTLIDAARKATKEKNDG